MEAVIKCRGLLLSKPCIVTQRRNVDYAKKFQFLRVRGSMIPETKTAMPDLPLFWKKYTSMMKVEYNFQRFLLDELLREAQVEKKLHDYEKVVVVNTDIASLVRKKLVPDLSSVVNGLLKALEPFPPDSRIFSRNMKKLTIKQLRNFVELDYLMWKYKVDRDVLMNAYKIMKFCLFDFRSLGNLQRCVYMLQRFEDKYKLNIPEKIYHLNQKPFNSRSVEIFQKVVQGMEWEEFPKHCPRIMQYSHHHILFVVSFLRSMNFSEKQITNSLPNLDLNFRTVVERLDYILSHPELRRYRLDEKFLNLLGYRRWILVDLLASCRASFEELIEYRTYGYGRFKRRLWHRGEALSRILFHMNQFFPVGMRCGGILRKHPKFRLACESQVRDTLRFLKDLDFTAPEIAESPAIVLYSRRNLEEAFEKIKSEEKTLQNYGLINGCVRHETDYFGHGTKEKRKILQLSLYYLEKPFNFSGDGVFQPTDESEIEIEID